MSNTFPAWFGGRRHTYFQALGGATTRYWIASAVSILVMVCAWEWYLMGYRFGVPRDDDLNFYYWIARRMESGESWTRILRIGHGPHMAVQLKLIAFGNLRWLGYDMQWIVASGPLIAAGWCVVVLAYARNLGATWIVAPAIVFFVVPPAISTHFDYTVVALNGSLTMLAIYGLFWALERFLKAGNGLWLIIVTVYLVFIVGTAAYQVAFAAGLLAAGTVTAWAGLPGAAQLLRNGRADLLWASDFRVMAVRTFVATVILFAFHAAYQAIVIPGPGGPMVLALDPVVILRAILNGLYVSMGGNMLGRGEFIGWSPAEIGLIGLGVIMVIVLISLPTLLKGRRVFILSLFAYPLVAMFGAVILRGPEATMFSRYADQFALVWVACVLAAVAYTFSVVSRRWLKVPVWGAVLIVACVNFMSFDSRMLYRASAANVERAANALLLTDDISGDFNPTLLRCRRTLDDCREAILDIRERRLGVDAERAVPGS